MDNIIPYLFIGDTNDASDYLGPKLSVLWPGESKMPEGSHHIATTYVDNNDVHVDIRAMEHAAKWIHEHLQSRVNTLVYCSCGVERSPLTVVWYLMRYKDMSLNSAYTVVKTQHPATIDRREWLPQYIPWWGCLPPIEERETNP